MNHVGKPDPPSTKGATCTSYADDSRYPIKFVSEALDYPIRFFAPTGMCGDNQYLILRITQIFKDEAFSLFQRLTKDGIPLEIKKIKDVEGLRYTSDEEV